MKILFSCLYSLFLSLQVLTPAAKYHDPKIDIIHYEFSLAINDTNDLITCSARIEVNLSDQAGEVVLDLDSVGPDGRGMKISWLKCNGGEAEWSHTGNKVTIRSCSPGLSEIVIAYHGIPADGLIISENKFGKRTFFADHWPDRASAYLPVVDHPSDKASVDFIITAPAHYEVVANGELTEASDLPGGFRLTHWKEIVPLPVKVMTFGAADFAIQLAGRVKDIPVWTWVYPENRKEGFHDYAVAVKPLEFYSELIGPYPYRKLANVQSKTIFGGLENAGCIFYSERSVTGEGRAESLIAHEIAHQWFGNSVTEGDWHHIWLSEGFATYLTSVYMEMNYGEERLKESMRNDRNRIVRNLEMMSHPVVDTAVTNLMRLLNVNSYQKGSWVLHMLRSEMGEMNFWTGMRNYYERFRNGNALTEDFRKIMEEAGGTNLESFFNQWLYAAGHPVLKASLRPGKKKGVSELIIEQTQDQLFEFSIEFSLKDKNGIRIITVPVRDKVTFVNVKASADAEVIPDPRVKLLFSLHADQ